MREGCGDAHKARSPCGTALCVSTVEPSKRVEGVLRTLIKRPKVCYP